MRLYFYGGAALVLLLAGFTAGWQTQGWRAGAREKTAVEAARAAESQAQQNVIDSLKSDIKVAQESSNGYQAELIRLRNAAALEPVRPVRVCKPARSPAPDLSTSSTTTGRSDAAREAGELLPGQAEDDIGPDLRQLVDEADQCSAQLRALIQWIEATRP